CHELEAELEAEKSTTRRSSVKISATKTVAVENYNFRLMKTKNHRSEHSILLRSCNRKSGRNKRQVEDAETLAAQNLAKYRQLQHALEDAEERAAAAENAMAKMRLKSRSGSYKPLVHSISSTAVNAKSNSSSRGRLLDDGVEE
ncbi:MYSc, partial [Parelaphostrongylus tenuis]